MSTLVIVESPTKAKTISKFLGSSYRVLSSYGHVRDLPKSDMGVDIEHGYQPKYEIPTKAKPHVKALKAAAKEADEVLFATDEDREGEAISWHLAEVLGIDPDKVKRIVFHEITKGAIDAAIAHPRALENKLVDAQQARRILDRLYGYEVSPILWRKIAPKLSAGRVQSVAIRIIVERERERMCFEKAGYWDIAGTFAKDGSAFAARLIEIDGARVANGKHFDGQTGKLSEDAVKKGVVHLLEDRARELAASWSSTSFTVQSVEEKPTTSSPSAPFTTSTLQQEAARKLRLGSSETMRTAQALYEQGYITYMRTDSTILSSQAVEAAREAVKKHFGANYLPAEGRQYQTKIKNAQEAHEAIRPAGELFRHPEDVKSDLSPSESALYTLIYQRTVASQMLPAKLRQTTALLSNGAGVFSASGKVVDFPGYLAVYQEGRDEEPDEAEGILPKLAEGDRVQTESLTPEGHETKPPARYTEATLIKVLEAHGIGRPSTFASIISTITAREYVRKVSQALVPTFKAFAVVQLLEQHFNRLVDIGFTAKMEDDLDSIAVGEKDMVPFLDAFYRGADKEVGLHEMLQKDIDPREACTVHLGSIDDVPLAVRIGRFGPYVEWGKERASLPDDITPDELTVDEAKKLLAEKVESEKPMGTDPASGLPVYARSGRFGPYVQLGERTEDKKNKPKMKSLPRGMTLEALTFDQALFLLSLPKSLGTHETLGEEVKIDIGRFGPYVKCGTETRSIPKDTSIFDMTFEKANELLAQEKKGRGRGRRTKTVLKDLGDGLEVLDGRYGAYVSDGKVNATIPKNTKPEDVTLEAAKELIKAKKEKASGA